MIIEFTDISDRVIKIGNQFVPKDPENAEYKKFMELRDAGQTTEKAPEVVVEAPEQKVTRIDLQIGDLQMQALPFLVRLALAKNKGEENAAKAELEKLNTDIVALEQEKSK